MKLSEELQWRGFVNQTTYKDLSVLDGSPITFYWGVDPSSDSMTIGNFAMAMMARHFIDHGHKAYLLVGGATGLIGDPDGKSEERDLKSHDEVEKNKAGIIGQYKTIFAGKPFDIVDNLEWFKGLGYLEFLREVGKHVPMRQMLGREFVQSRLGEDGTGISYAEFSYSLIQGYDFLHLHREHGVTLQVAGADQWGNSIAGVELIRRVTGDEAHIWTGPLVINKVTGKKFGKSEVGAVWLDPRKTTPTQFYQFWINVDDVNVLDYLKIYTLIPKPELEALVAEHLMKNHERLAQKRLAEEVTRLVHGEDALQFAQRVTEYLTGSKAIAEADDKAVSEIRRNLPSVPVAAGSSILEALVATGLCSSLSDARRMLQGNAVAINGEKIAHDSFQADDFTQGKLMLRRGKAYKDSALIELQG